MFHLLRPRCVQIHNVLNSVAMSTNKRIFSDKVGKATKKLCLRDPNSAFESVAAIVIPQTETMDSVAVLATPIKPESDKKNYRLIRLGNGLKALLISDPSAIDDQIEPIDATSANQSTRKRCTSHGKEATEETSSSEDEDEEVDEEDEEDEEEDDSEQCDKRQKQAACALCVDVGSFSDPWDIQGLAHFLEHMIFMGSEKYPNENEFDQYIKKCGGFDNADTDYEETSYYFEVQEPYLDGALDRFSGFFKSPLMLKEAMTREREAVESEFSSRMNGEEVRRDQLLASLGQHKHPVSIFAWGNLITLKEQIDDETLYKRVHAFWKRHYSAHRMYLCLQARLPLDDLQKMVVEHFSGIVNNQMDGDDFTAFTHENAFRSEFSQKIYFIKPISNISKIDITWCLGPILQAYKTKPHHYLSFLLGDEGKGSLLSYLRKKLWSMDLAAGIDESGLGSNSLFSLFTISVHVTDEGFAHLREVLEAIFSYIRFLREVGPNERIFNELKMIEETSFRFHQDREPLDYVEDVVISVKQYPPEHILNGECLYFEYDPVAIQNVTDEINKPNFNIMITSTHLYDQNVTYDLKEKWFGTEYCERDVPDDWKNAWNVAKPYPEFVLPAVNPFIADDFTILFKQCEQEPLPKLPVKLMDNEVCELWHRQDDRFGLPVARYYFYFMSPCAMGTAENMVLMNLLTCNLKYQLVEALYPATSTGLEYSCYTAEKGVVLKVSGFNQKLHLIVNAFAEKLKTLANDVTEDQFSVFVEQQLKNFENIFLKPKSISRDLRLSILDQNHIALPEKNQILKTLSFDAFKSFCTRYLQQIKIKAVLQGNLNATQAEKITNDVLDVLDCGKIDNLTDIDIRTMKIPNGSTYLRCKAYNPNDVNTVVINFYQIGSITIRLNALIDLLVTIAEEPVFDILRTKEQLAYDVSVGIRDNQGVLGYTITVNSQESKFTADYVDERIENFRKELLQIITEKSNEDFEQYKQSLILIKLTEDTDLKDEIARNWAEVTSDEYIFDRVQQEVNALRSITQEELIEFYSNSLGDNEQKFSTQIIGNPNGNKTSDDVEEDVVVDKSIFDRIEIVEFKENAKGVLIRDISRFKKTLDVYPVSKTNPLVEYKV